eukprot:TRINITY_DN3845_c0_g1_i1.p1 TRINITY_DN3845_c0_g1~~TRINITY_DN3845_c0_g1_i1.p1  ORF type:complete len:103 (+),score=4.56 TRINITY_DN3845_c0_g1_i1:240-548(+)
MLFTICFKVDVKSVLYLTLFTHYSDCFQALCFECSHFPSIQRVKNVFNFQSVNYQYDQYLFAMTTPLACPEKASPALIPTGVDYLLIRIIITSNRVFRQLLQ